MSQKRAIVAGVEPGSRPLYKTDIDQAAVLVAEGLSMLEGAMPVSTVPPAAHTLTHYAEAAKTHGVLKWYWLMGFERFNKHIKNSVKNTNHPLASLSASHILNASARFADWADGTAGSAKPDCACQGKGTGWMPEGDVLAELLMLIGCTCCSIVNLQVHTTTHPTARVLGRRFTAGEPLTGKSFQHYHNPRCGSVITSILRGTSYYGRVTRFFTSGCRRQELRSFACVDWLAAPVYPDDDPLTVVIDTTKAAPKFLPLVLPLECIYPAQILFEPDGSKLYMVCACRRGVLLTRELTLCHLCRCGLMV